MDTIALRRAAKMSSPSNASRFNHALLFLQAYFKILPVGVARVGSWNYAHCYDLTARHYPDIPEKARSIKREQAHLELVQLYMHSVGAISFRELNKIFGWGKIYIEKVISELVQIDVLRRGLEMKDQYGEWVALKILA